jgi:hypothetical protein
MSNIYNPIPDVQPSYGGIQAYTHLTSVSPGESIQFHVWIQGATPGNPAPFSVRIDREENGPILITTLNDYSFEQPTNQEPSINGCGWAASLKWTVPSDLKSGVYRATLTSGSYSNYLIFFIKATSPGENNKILYVGSVNTWEAYNDWGGKSLYHGEDGSFESRARKVSFNRPPRIWDFDRWELPFIKWFYQSRINGHLPEDMEMEFCSNIDLHADPTIVNNYKLVIFPGHDEYWSWEMRNTIQDFVAQGNGNVAFLSGNICWWQVRFEGDEEGNPDRTIICFKNYEEDREAYPAIPDDRMTVNWFEKIINRPENLMTGASYYFGTALWNSYNAPFKVRLQKHWLLKGTGLSYGSEFGNNLFIQFETDSADFADYDRKFPIPTGKLAYDSTEFFAPKDLMILAAANLVDLANAPHPYGYWCGPNYHSGWATIGVFRKRNGGFVFHVGHTNWSKDGLTGNWNEFSQITKNVLEIFSNDFEPQPFLLENPGFENQQAGWESKGNGTIIIATPGYQSNNCVFIDSSNADDTFLFQQYIPIRTRRNYRIKCFAKPGNPTEALNSAISIRLEIIDIYDNPVQEFIVANYPTGNLGWTQITATGSLSSTDSEDVMSQARVKLLVKSGSSAYFDDVVVEEL